MTNAQYYKVYLVIFSSTLGREQSEIVEAATLEHLNTWIANYKLSYCPDASHTIEPINGAKMSDTANKA